MFQFKQRYKNLKFNNLNNRFKSRKLIHFEISRNAIKPIILNSNQKNGIYRNTNISVISIQFTISKYREMQIQAKSGFQHKKKPLQPSHKGSLISE